MRTINTLSNPVTVASELPLKLARKCVDIFGYASFDEEQTIHTLNPGCDDEISMVTAGKEFGLLKTVSGKVGIMFQRNISKNIFKNYSMHFNIICYIFTYKMLIYHSV